MSNSWKTLSSSSCLPYAVICSPVSIHCLLPGLFGWTLSWSTCVLLILIWFYSWLPWSLFCFISGLLSIISVAESPVLFLPWAHLISSAFCLFSSLNLLHQFLWQQFLHLLLPEPPSSVLMTAISYAVILMENWGHLIKCPPKNWKTGIQTKICTQMLIAALFIIVKKWK